jgi:hypothetical protein
MSLEQITVKRSDVLEIVRENKKKHDSIFKDAVDGFWNAAEEVLKKNEKETITSLEKRHKEKLKAMRKELKVAKKNLKDQTKKELEFVKKKEKNSPWYYMKNIYPENHSDDYEGTIRRLELCVDSEVELDEVEFDKYIRNKWQWRDSFLSNNTGYAMTVRSNGNVGLGTSTLNSKLEVSNCKSNITGSFFCEDIATF